MFNRNLIMPILRYSMILLIICGLIYPAALVGLGQVVMPQKSSGSIIYNQNGDPIGSKLIGQQFNDPSFFHGRISSINYDASASGSPNYAPSNKEMINRTKNRVEEFKKNNPEIAVSEIPVDLVTNSASGLDPHISPESAVVQIPRISKKTGISEKNLNELIESNIKYSAGGFFGNPHINVLTLNLALNDLITK